MIRLSFLPSVQKILGVRLHYSSRGRRKAGFPICAECNDEPRSYTRVGRRVERFWQGHSFYFVALVMLHLPN